MALLELQVDEVFSLSSGLDAIEREMKRSRSVEFIHVPLFLLREWQPLLTGKKITLYDNLIEGLPEDLQGLGREVFTSVQMRGTLYGKVVEKGEVFVKNRIFSLWYQGDRILHIGGITYRRCVRCIQSMHREILLQDEREVLNIMTLYDPEAGTEAILRAVEHSTRVRMVNLPKSLVRKIVILLETQDIKILCAERSDEARMVAEEHPARVSAGLLNVYSSYKGKKVKSGGIALDESFFSVDYLGDEIYLILSIVWPRCPSCMADFYELGWRAAGRIR